MARGEECSVCGEYVVVPGDFDFDGLCHQCEINDLEQTIERLLDERHILAMLAADSPQFSNPLHVYEARKLRDRVLAKGPPSSNAHYEKEH